MEKYRVSILLSDENGNAMGSTTVSSEYIDDIKAYHGISALDETLKALLKEVEEVEDRKVK